MNAKHLQFSAFVLLLAFVGLDAKRGRDQNILDNTDESAEDTRQGKVLSLFQIVRFPNDPCIGNGDKNGTCYTADECESKNGVSSGSCADGFGVCCTFSATCGSSTSENCTYFESTGSESGSCSIDICRCSDNICQLRLDFNQFVISGPSTDSTTIGLAVAGSATDIAAGVPVTAESQCLTDTFTVSNPGSRTPSVICGDNTGQHLYVDVCGETCNQLTFQLGNMGMGTALATRNWNIKITQYSCDYENLAPDGCDQYFFGANTGTVESFNFAGGQHLANQDQNICIRRERGNCRICWTTAEMGDFMVSGMTPSMGVIMVCFGILEDRSYDFDQITPKNVLLSFK